MIQFDSCVFFKWIGETTTNFCVSLCGDFFAPPKKKGCLKPFNTKNNRIPPRNLTARCQKWHYLKPESPFPMPIILGIQPLVFGGASSQSIKKSSNNNTILKHSSFPEKENTHTRKTTRTAGNPCLRKHREVP